MLISSPPPRNRGYWLSQLQSPLALVSLTMAKTSPPASQDAVPATRLASSPFDKPEADIVLRSADGVDFCVRRHILFEASPIFESILSIPQSSTDLRPIVDLVEDQKTLDTILRICYPIVKVKSSLQLEVVERAVKAAQKYEMELPLAVLTNELLEFATISPLAVWAIGCRTGLEDVARHAAAILKEPLEVEVDYLDGVSAGDYFRLLEFHRKGGKADDNFRFLNSNEASIEQRTPAPHIPLITLPHSDLVCKSSDGLFVSAHKACTASASPVLGDRIEKASNFTSAGHPILQFTEEWDILMPLLRLCYPDRGTWHLPSDPSHVSQLVDIVVALDKYRMRNICGAVLQTWKTVAEASPIRAYLAAARRRARACAEIAAKCTLGAPLEGQYVADMEYVPAVAYHRLLTYHASCRAVAKQLLRDVLSALAPEVDCGTKEPPSGRAYLKDLRGRNLNSNDVKLEDNKRKPPLLYGTVYVATTEPKAMSASDSVALRRSQDSWFESYIEQLIARADTHPSDVPLSITTFDAAIASGQWCSTCRGLAMRVRVADRAVCSISGRIAQVSLVV
ncbi:hypothetical protein LXA43DRAFT_573194 [Ganoderma leucocontextum]|nr:hypothetical protein LXA43DRAFT_573194 [Ganoderma leucocontextum]